MLNVTSETGGGPIVCDILTKQVDPLSFKLYYVATDNGPYYEKIRKNVTAIFDINLRKISISNLIKLINLIKTNNIDIIHSHGRAAGVYSRILGILLRKKVIHTFHGIHYNNYKNLIKRKAVMVIENIMAAWSYNIFVSNGERKSAEEMGLTNFLKSSRTILNGIDLKRFDKVKESLYKEKIQILTLSQISYHKGLDILVDAVKYLVENGVTNFEMIIAGDCIPQNISFKMSLQETIDTYQLHPYIKLIGIVENSEEILMKSDIYISASRGEGLPLSLIEAMASGTLVVASDVVGNNDIIKNGENGYLISIKDFNSELKQLLVNYRQNEKENSKMIFKAKEDVNAYDSIRMVNEYEVVYKKLIINN